MVITCLFHYPQLHLIFFLSLAQFVREQHVEKDHPLKSPLIFEQKYINWSMLFEQFVWLYGFLPIFFLYICSDADYRKWDAHM